MHFNEWLLKVWQLPWTFKAFLCFVLGSYVWNWLNGWRKRSLRTAAETWPAISGRVVAREIKERKQGEDANVDAFVAVVTYSYFQSEQQSGTYRREFDSQDEAGAWLDLLYEKEIQVRVDPASPSRSTLLDSDLPAAPAVSLQTDVFGGQQPGASPKIFSLDMEAENAAGSRPVLAMLSAAGLVVCSVLHLMALTGEPFGAGVRFGLLFGMQIYAIVVFGFAAMLDRDRAAGITTALYNKQIDSVTPEGFRILQKVLSGYSMLWFGWFIYRSAVLHQNSEIDPLPLFSAFQAIFLLEAYKKTQLPRWRLENGTQNRLS
jgi:Protein of unknown function (DUF3592)